VNEKAARQAPGHRRRHDFPAPAGARESGGFAEAADADIVIIAIGEPGVYGQTRLDLFDNSLRMLGESWSPCFPCSFVAGDHDHESRGYSG
jgi:L-lactate dehydrogenase